MTPRPLKAGEIVQLGPNTKNTMFAFCLLTVSEPKSFGCQGYVQALGEGGLKGGQAYYRPTWDEMEPTGGMAYFVIGSSF